MSESQPAPSTARANLRRIASLAWPERRRLLAGTVVLLIGSATGLAAPKLIGDLVGEITAGAGREAVGRYALLLLVLLNVGGVATSLRSYWFTGAGEAVVARLRRELFASLIRQEVGFFDAHRTGELTNRLSSDTTVLRSAVTVNVSMALRFSLQAIGSVVLLWWLSWQLTAVLLAAVPLVVAGGVFYARILRDIARAVQDALARATEVAEETLSGVRTVRAFAREGAETARYAVAVDRTYALSLREARLGAIAMALGGFAGYAVVTGVLWFGGILLAEGRMGLDALTSYLLYTFSLAFAVGALAGLWQDFVKALGASARVFELLDRQAAVAGGSRRLERVEGAVALVDVTFRYPSRPDRTVLDGVSVALDPGVVVALVGPSGGGKSTVAALLSRFYDPDSGAVTLDGVDYRELDPDWLRAQVGVVSQEPILFATSIEENIRYGRPDASDAEVEAAARAANAHAFIAELPEGYATEVGERGVRLSGGQKQRVAIARALLKDPRVLVLDEATSALDAESEHLVQEALDRLMEGRSTLVIAHRLSTVMAADRVVVLDGGRVAEQGTHFELMASGGLYRRLVERQFAAA